MLLCPLENTAIFKREWISMRPKITQKFGENPKTYARFGMNGHNGIDLRAKIGTPVFAPTDGMIKIIDDKNDGYGLHIKLRNTTGKREIVLGHLSKTCKKSGSFVYMGELIGYTGNTGFSTGPHLHFGFRKLISARGNVFGWNIENYNNGYYGYIDPLPYLITFKGTLEKYKLV